jgi:hypothetical protein
MAKKIKKKNNNNNNNNNNNDNNNNNNSNNNKIKTQKRKPPPAWDLIPMPPQPPADATAVDQPLRGAKLIFKTHLAPTHQQKKQVPLLRKRQIRNEK